MDHSFTGFRVKSQQCILSSDSEEDEDLILDSSVMENGTPLTQPKTPTNEFSNRDGLDDYSSHASSSRAESDCISEETNTSFVGNSDDEVLSNSVVIEESFEQPSDDLSHKRESAISSSKSNGTAEFLQTKAPIIKTEEKGCGSSSTHFGYEEHEVETDEEIYEETDKETRKTDSSPIAAVEYDKHKEEKPGKVKKTAADISPPLFEYQKHKNVLRSIGQQPQFERYQHRSSSEELLGNRRRMSEAGVIELRSSESDSSVEALTIVDSRPGNSPTDSTSSLQWDSLPTTDIDTQNFGKTAMKTHLTQQSMTMERLATLHSALKSCPLEGTLAEDPRGLKVPLMPHQKHALAWLRWREQERPRGGILADDMGLGKTLTMISLVLKAQQDDTDGDDDDDDDDDGGEEDENTPWLESGRHHMPRGGTLVVCPASLVTQWEQEVKKRCDKGLLSVLLYHGNSRETKTRRLARKDIVITTYNLVSRESGVETAKNCTVVKKPGPLHSIKWDRIILDEAHIVRNHKSRTALAVFELSGKHRWCLTGTPIQNREFDLYSLMKFLRCSPFDDLVVWRRWVDNKNAAGMQRLSMMMKSLMLRRTKEQLQEKGALQNLPTKTFEIIPVQLDTEELKIYQKVAIFSSTLFAQFLGQRAEKDQMLEARYGQSNLPTWEQEGRPDNQYLANDKLAEIYEKIKNRPEVKSHEILVLLLRLRQICCHAGLIKQMLEKEDFTTVGVEDDSGVDIDLLSAMDNLAVSDETQSGSSPTSSVPALSPENPVLEFSRPSSKVRAVLDVILEKLTGTEDKAVVVSQWTSMLNIVGDHLKDMGVKCEMLSGKVPVQQRLSIVEEFNSSRGKFKILLLSLTAGGVGLNLVGGNHLFLIDVHWNPQLEAQACDRIYRVGQRKPVFIYKFICQDTVEDRIKRLQEQKLALADNVLTGTRNAQASKLSLQDLKMLFDVGGDQFS